MREMMLSSRVGRERPRPVMVWAEIVFRLRIFASILSVLSLAIALWALMQWAAGEVSIALLIAAACLAIVSPFDAPDPRRRTRVMFACLAHVAAIATALLLARAVGSGSLTGALAMLVALGVGLACWALATRNRRRMSGLQRYYHN